MAGERTRSSPNNPGIPAGMGGGGAGVPGGPVRFGPYQLDSRIAVGGTAEVYLAHPVDPNATPRKLVVKRLLPNFAGDPEGRTMFEREARLHKAVSHENVVTVFGSGTSDDGEPYLAMEYIDGVDGYRLLRRLRQENELLPLGMAVHVAREVLRALESVHTAKDSSGNALGIIHRDVTPSNLYLSQDGRVKLGDFGIARSSRQTMRSEASAVLKGKFAYLAPEQVAGEPFDHRADLFSLATVLAEMLLGKPLFPGGGQLAVLLAIRDCRIDSLHEVAGRLPKGLMPVLERALARDPDARFPSAAQFATALAPFEADASIARRDLAVRVRWVQSTPSIDAMSAVRESMRAMRAVSAPPAKSEAPAPEDEFNRKTGEYGSLPSYVVTASGSRQGPWTFARLMEALATGQVGRGDRIDYMGRGLMPLEAIEELQRFLPIRTATTDSLDGPGLPDFREPLAPSADGMPAMLAVLLRILEAKETGVLFVEREADESGQALRKELYFVGGKLHHVASTNTSELLGEFLVRRGTLAREELDLALAVLPKYQGRMGDTLIALGLAGPVDIFRAIREQGRDRVADIFTWKSGNASFYRGQRAPHVEFPLDLDLPPLLLAGLEASQPSEFPLEMYRARLEQVIGPATADRARMKHVVWPTPVLRILTLANTPKSLKELLRSAAREVTGNPANAARALSREGGGNAADALRALELLLAARMLEWK